MSYQISITRASDRFSAEQHPISHEEWLQFVEGEPSLETSRTDYTEWKDIGRIYSTVWLECPDPKNGPNQLHWYDFAITVWHPDEAIIAKMVEIAARLKANVIGEEGEFYGQDAQPAPSRSY